MIKKILIANRGEIAVRIIKTCKKLGITTVAIYSTDDKDSLHVRIADESVCTEKESSNDGYTNINNIIQAAINKKCDAIHPGYGFLSENYEFAKAVESNNLIWIGTNSDIMKKVENKHNIKKEVEKLNIPVIKEFEKEKVKQEDFPLLIKEAFGAGGKGIEKVNNIECLNNIYNKMKNLNEEELYIEKYIKGFRHIEIQFAVDNFRNVIIFPERDCSIQEKYKKVIECTPSFDVPKNIVTKLKHDTEKIVRHLKYNNIGTAEFIIDCENNYYFLEINPRIQVEHTITEMITNIDLIKLQISIAGHQEIKNYKIQDNGKYAIESRVYAKKAGEIIQSYKIPNSKYIRVDTEIFDGMKISPRYDPLLAKIICVGNTRIDAISKMVNALNEFQINGVDTNKDSLYRILTSQCFLDGKYCLQYDFNNVRISAMERLKLICDENSFIEIDKENKKENETILIGIGKIHNLNVAIGIMDANYMAGSIGTFLTNKLCFLIKYAKINKLPLLILSSSGGIRVQEGVNALVGMAKLSAVIKDFKEDGLFISFFTNPTYGGLNASLSMLGDINIAEEGCKIGFSGARIIENELHQNLPKNFQTEEYNLENGYIDIITSKDNEKETIYRLLEQFYHHNNTKEIQYKETKTNTSINKLDLIRQIRSEVHIRPETIVNNLFTDLIELHGDRVHKEDNAVKCFFAKLNDIDLSVIYVNRQNNLQNNILSNFGMIRPDGYRKINRFIKLSEKMKSPVVIFIDTQGADAGIYAEENGQASAIANLLQDISKISVPILSFITGEANSGGAIALTTGDYLCMLEHSYFSVISPESYSDIVYKGKKKIDEVIQEMRILPKDLIDEKIIDEIIQDSDFENMIEEIKAIINNKIHCFSELTKEELICRRLDRIENWGAEKHE